MSKKKTNASSIQQRRDGFVPKIVPKATSLTRNDVASWRAAIRSAKSIDMPRRAKLINIYDDILLDAHLTSQLELRYQHTLSAPWSLKNRDGEEDEETVDRLSSIAGIINRRILETIAFGKTVLEFTTNDAGNLSVSLIPRSNVVPERGLILRSEDDSTGLAFRELREYGTWIIEFGEDQDLGLLNKAVPHVLMKRFAQSCWSELCEIYGIPPRYMKTDTQDAGMLDRAEQMLREMGSAAWFIIDSSEEFEFAQGAVTNGDVYNNLIRVCKEELSLLISGAVIGQDTTNGNRSKEESSIKLLDKLVKSDKKMLANHWNAIVLPALVKIGLVPEGVYFEFQQEEDLEKLWKMTRDVLPYMTVDPTWIISKFGMAVTGTRDVSLSADSDFFD